MERIKTAWGRASAWAVVFSAATALAQPSLFKTVEGPLPKGGASLESFRNDSTVKSVNVTELNRTALDGERAEFNPSSAEKKVLRFMESRRVEGSGKEIRHGIVEGVPGSAVTLFIRETYVRGFVRAGSSLYVIEPLGDGLYSVVHYDAGKFPKEF